MRRRLFTAASVLSLLLFVATVVLWVRSYTVAHYLLIAGSNKYVLFGVNRGEAQVYAYPNLPYPMVGTVDLMSSPAQIERYSQGKYGFSTGYAWQDGWFVTAPCWAIALCWTIAPGMRLMFKLRRAPRGLCPTCRYNLTGNTSGVCPECGAAVAGNVANV